MFSCLPPDSLSVWSRTRRHQPRPDRVHPPASTSLPSPPPPHFVPQKCVPRVTLHDRKEVLVSFVVSFYYHNVCVRTCLTNLIFLGRKGALGSFRLKSARKPLFVPEHRKAKSLSSEWDIFRLRFLLHLPFTVSPRLSATCKKFSFLSFSKCQNH